MFSKIILLSWSKLVFVQSGNRHQKCILKQVVSKSSSQWIVDRGMIPTNKATTINKIGTKKMRAKSYKSRRFFKRKKTDEKKKMETKTKKKTKKIYFIIKDEHIEGNTVR